jgi:hypothetical protein
MIIKNSSGGYKNLPFFKQSEIIYDFTVEFCKKYIDEITTALRDPNVAVVFDASPPIVVFGRQKKISEHEELMYLLARSVSEVPHIKKRLAKLKVGLFNSSAKVFFPQFEEQSNEYSSEFVRFFDAKN